VWAFVSPIIGHALGCTFRDTSGYLFGQIGFLDQDAGPAILIAEYDVPAAFALSSLGALTGGLGRDPKPFAKLLVRQP
jgi:hypothetical protein